MANTPRLVTTKQADALAELYVWDTVVEILEGSTAPRDESGQKAARKVIAIAKAEQKKLFRKYDAEARHDDFAALQAEIEALRAEVEEMQRRLDREESDHGRTIDQRDAAEDALGRMFQAVTGRTAEWSSAWGYVDAIEEVEEHVATLATERDQLAAALEAAREDAAEAKQNGYELGLLAAAREDAERYRHLFDCPEPFCYRGDVFDSKQEADAAIDQARGKAGQEVGK